MAGCCYQAAFLILPGLTPWGYVNIRAAWVSNWYPPKHTTKKNRHHAYRAAVHAGPAHAV